MTTSTVQAAAASVFVLGSGPVSFTWTVRVPVPADDDYRFAELPLIFEAVDQDELDKMRGIGLEDGELPPSDAQIARRVVIGWPSLTDADGQPVPFSPEALKRLLSAPLVRTSIVATYMACMSGMAARKNG